MIALVKAVVGLGGTLDLRSGNWESFYDALIPYAGKRIELIARLPKKRGSDNQQRYYWGVLIRRIADEIGEHGNDGMERVHDALMRQFLPTERRGQIEIRRSYADLDSAEREKYHEMVRIAASTGDLIGSPLWLPLPNEAEL